MAYLLSSTHIDLIERPSDAVSEKLLQTLKQHRPSSTHSNISLRAPSAKSNRSTVSVNTALSFKATQRRSISQLDSEIDPSEKSYLLRLNYQQQVHYFDQKTTEKVIYKRITAKNMEDSRAYHQFQAYPEFYENYHPTLPFKQKKLEEARAVAGRKYLYRFNYDQYLNSMHPANRAKRPDMNQYRSILTDELDKCSLDIAVRIQELQLRYKGYSDEVISAQIQRDQAMAQRKPPVFNTISEKIQYEDAQKFNYIINRDYMLGSQVLQSQRGFYRSRKGARGSMVRSSLDSSAKWVENEPSARESAGQELLAQSAPPEKPYW